MAQRGESWPAELARWAEDAANGDKDAEADLVEVLRRRALGWGRRRSAIVGRPLTDEDNQDAAHVALATFFEKLRGRAYDRDRGEVQSYFWGIWRNVRRRFESRNRTVPWPDEDPPGPDPGPDEGVEFQRLRDCLRRCADRLLATPEQNETWGYLLDGLTPREAAGLVGIETNAMYVRMHRVRKATRPCKSLCLEGAPA